MRNGLLAGVRGAPLILLAACVCGWLAAPGVAAERYGDVSVSVSAPPVEETAHGYTEYRVTLTNDSSKQSHAVTLVLPHDAYGSGHYIRRLTRTASVAPSSQIVVSLFVPPLEIRGDGLRVIVDGRTQRRPLALDVSRSVATPDPYRYSSFGGGGPSDEGGLLVFTSRDVDVVLATRVLSELEGETDGRQALVETVRAESVVEGWSTNWLAYSCYDGVLVTGNEMVRMHPDARSALWQWVECGGTLIVLGEADVPATWRSRRVGREERVEPEEPLEREESAGGEELVEPQGARSTYVGFGQCLELSDTSESALGDAVTKTVAEALRDSFKPFGTVESVENANDAFPVVEGLTSPVRGLMLLMLVFVITIGPVNLLVLSRFKRRIWLLWTVPVISLLTCGAVTLYAAIAEGWTGRARAETLTILDQSAHRATTIGWAAFYCPVTPRGGLRFGYETELSPQVGPQGDYYSYREGRGGRAREVDWTDDQHLVSGWVSARVPAHFRVRKSEMCRVRLTVTAAADGSLTLVNGLGADIGALWLADDEGAIYRAEHIAAGKEVALGKPVANSTSSGTPERLRSAYSQDWLTSTRALVSSPANYLMPGTYIAVLDKTPFLEGGLRRAKRDKCRSIVYGIIGEPLGRETPGGEGPDER